MTAAFPLRYSPGHGEESEKGDNKEEGYQEDDPEEEDGAERQEARDLETETRGGHRLARVPLPVAVVGILVLLPLCASCAVFERASQSWWELRRDSSSQAPDPATTPEPVVQVYAARAVGWRGVLAVHTWTSVKRREAPAFTRYEVIGWGVDQGTPAVRVNRMGPDNYWFGARPELLVELRGDGVEAVVDKIETAVAAYPYRDSYLTFPGPNSNTFTAWIGREVPELGLHLPPTAIGKDYLPHGLPVGRSPAGRGVQLSLFGLLGVLAGVDEGLEVNVLGLVFGVDVKDPALKLPFVGRVGTSPPSTR
ncbi:MAG: DUF3750 domain-containing protein [Candidatus Rokuibacteriota bacterium]